MRSRLSLITLLTTFILLPCALAQTQLAHAQTIARCGKGWVEKIDGYTVLHLKGSPYEMGYQHGVLLKESIKENLRNILENKKAASVEIGGITVKPRWLIHSIAQYQKPHVPEWYQEELAGLAAGSQLNLDDLVVANFIPELFHCSGFAVMNSATSDGTLYHGRVLDYACDWKLQDHAVLIVAEPDGGIPFCNVTYAGFVGSVTGMNAKQVAIGEMGGGGLGHWDGTPMAVLMRTVMQEADDLDEAIEIFRRARRTCQYYYVISDGKTNRALGVAASWDALEVVQPGEAHPRLPKPVKDCVLLSAGSRYDELVRRAQTMRGQIDAAKARSLMDRPVATGSNLHNVLFEPAATRLWIANAGIDGKPAADQPYHEFQLSELLKRQPEASSDDLSIVAPKP